MSRRRRILGQRRARQRGELESLARAGVLGFKCFLTPSGVEEFAHVGEADCEEALPVLGELGCRCSRMPSCRAAPSCRRRSARRGTIRGGTRRGSRAVPSQRAGAQSTCSCAWQRESRRAHPRRPSGDRRGAAAIRAARGAGRSRSRRVRTTSRSPPKRSPTARPRSNARRRSIAANARLWPALAAARSTSSPATIRRPAGAQADRRGRLRAAWGGIASLQLALPAVWTGAAERGVPVERLARWMSGRPPASRVSAAKGAIAAGRDADLVICDPDAETIVDARALYHRHPMTPYAGRRCEAALGRRSSGAKRSSTGRFRESTDAAHLLEQLNFQPRERCT